MVIQSMELSEVWKSLMQEASFTLTLARSMVARLDWTLLASDTQQARKCPIFQLNGLAIVMTELVL
jgi:hypothetical protein